MSKYAFLKHTIMAHSNSRAEFFHAIRMIGIGIEYTNQGIPVGIIDGGKVIKWDRIGIQPQDFALLDQKQQLCEIKLRLNRLEELKHSSKQTQNLKPKL